MVDAPGKDDHKRQENGSDSGEKQKDIKEQARKARTASRTLQSLPPSVRSKILHTFAKKIQHEEAKKKILAENKKDTDAAEKDDKMSNSLKKRLVLNDNKLKTCAEGLIQLADGEDPIGRVVRRTQVAENLELQQITVPLGVLLIIFEARPEVLPQIVALGVESGNGLLLKGGKETTNSLNILYKIATDSITEGSDGKVKGEELVVLLSGRSEVDALLEMDDVIDLVIPRGGNSLVSYIQNHTKIPVMGHSEGVCHVYVDKDADIKKAIPLIVDSKTDYAAACNAMETLLIHKDVADKFDQIAEALKKANVRLYGGPKASKQLKLEEVEDMHHEYSDLQATVEIVDSFDDAISHIHKYGSSHTELIVTENQDTAKQFVTQVDSACVFVNASTRFSDGYRFGLGAEVGISTGRLHARGPVGVDGITTTKWVLISKNKDGDTAQQYADEKKKFVHKPIEIDQKKSFTRVEE